MNLFYAESNDIQSESLIVRGQEAHHMSRVLRHSVGDVVFVTDGRGTCYECKIQSFQKNAVFLDVLEIKEHTEALPLVTLCLGIIKKRDRMEFAVEKSVELGVSKIIFFKGEHSQKENVREDRLKSTAISAMKQSLRYNLPEIFIEESLEEAVSRHSENSSIIIADETIEDSSSEKYSKENYFLIVGPEGGFSKNEREYLNRNEPAYYSLGERRLRTETAAIVMVDRFKKSK